MNAPTVDDQFGFSLGDLTYIDLTYDDEAASTIVRVHTHRFAHWFSRLLPNVAEWQRRRAVMQEMAMMTDRELSDIGLSRADLARIFDPSLRRQSRARPGLYCILREAEHFASRGGEICNVSRPFVSIDCRRMRVAHGPSSEAGLKSKATAQMGRQDAAHLVPQQSTRE